MTITHTGIQMAIAIVLFFQLPLLSQEVDTTKFKVALSMPLEDLLMVKIVTASKTERASQDITQKFDIISEKQFDEIIQDKRNIAELIQYSPGASVKVLSRNDANWGAYGGIGPKYSTYMVQGLPVDAFIDPQSLDAQAIKHIEIQRGPASVLYPNYLSQDFAGNQSPLAGTVNLILKEKVEKAKSLISLGLGSYNTYNGQVYHENRFGKVHYVSGVSYEKSEYTNYGTEKSWLNMIDNPAYDKTKIFIGTTIFPKDDDSHKISIWGNQTLHRGNWGRINRKYDFQYSLLNVGYSGKINEKLNVSLKTGLRWYGREYEGDDYGNNDLSITNISNVEQLIIPTDLSFNFNHFNNSNLIIGADFQNADYLTEDQPVNDNKLTGNDATVKQLGFYAQEELQFKKFTIRAGGRYNNINYDISRIGSEIPGSDKENWHVFLWSAGAKFRIIDELAIFTNAGNSFMSPSLKSIGGTVPASEKYLTGSNGQLANPGLEPENGISIDFGTEASIPADIKGFKFTTTGSARGFYTSIKDAIIDKVISEDPSQTISVNAGESKTYGFELSLKQDYKMLHWFANFTYIDTYILNPEDDNQNYTEIPFVPGHMGNLGLTFYVPFDIKISPWIHWGGKIYDSNSRTDRNAFDSGEVINLVLSKKFTIKSSNEITLLLKFYNLTDNRYKMPWQFQDTGRNISLTTRFEF